MTWLCRWFGLHPASDPQDVVMTIPTGGLPIQVKATRFVCIRCGVVTHTIVPATVNPEVPR